MRLTTLHFYVTFDVIPFLYSVVLHGLKLLFHKSFSLRFNLTYVILRFILRYSTYECTFPERNSLLSYLQQVKWQNMFV